MIKAAENLIINCVNWIINLIDLGMETEKRKEKGKSGFRFTLIPEVAQSDHDSNSVDNADKTTIVKKEIVIENSNNNGNPKIIDITLDSDSEDENENTQQEKQNDGDIDLNQALQSSNSNDSGKHGRKSRKSRKSGKSKAESKRNKKNKNKNIDEYRLNYWEAFDKNMYDCIQDLKEKCDKITIENGCKTVTNVANQIRDIKQIEANLEMKEFALDEKIAKFDHLWQQIGNEMESSQFNHA